MNDAEARAAEVLAAHEMVGKATPALPDHACRIVVDCTDCGCTRIVVGCTGCGWTTEADGTQGEAFFAHVATVLAAENLLRDPDGENLKASDWREVAEEFCRERDAVRDELAKAKAERGKWEKSAGIWEQEAVDLLADRTRAERRYVDLVAKVRGLADLWQVMAEGSAQSAAAREGLSDAKELADHSDTMTRRARDLRALLDGAQ